MFTPFLGGHRISGSSGVSLTTIYLSGSVVDV